MATVDSTVRAGAPAGWVGPGPSGGAAGAGPYRLALRRLRRNKGRCSA
jgi:hypothetical protein